MLQKVNKRSDEHIDKVILGRTDERTKLSKDEGTELFKEVAWRLKKVID